MQCKKCKSEWKTDQSISASLVCCPFCGESLIDENNSKPNFFDNSKDALAYIAQKHGIAILLGGRLKSFFPDYAPQVSLNIRRLVFAVYENGAASILQDNLNSQADKEIVFKQAVAKLTENFIAQDAAENIIYEFTMALGWQLSMPMQTRRQPTARQQNATKKQMTDSAAATQRGKKQSMLNRTQTEEQSKSSYLTDISPVIEIALGRRHDIQFGGYAWWVLDVQNDKALLLAESIIEQYPYNKAGRDITWKDCTLHQYLNNEFYQKFTSQEQTMILPAKNINASNQWYPEADGGNNTTDKIFLLSIEEAVRYFGNSGQLTREPSNVGYVNDEFNANRVARYGNCAWWWWLRSPGYRQHRAAAVFGNGHLRIYGFDVSCVQGGVRPALWLNLK